MPFIPHTPQDTADMLESIGVAGLADLFAEIPDRLRCQNLPAYPERLNELGITRLMKERARTDGQPLSFLGAGAYEHHIPAAVWQIAARGEFYTAYTPYQAEASQGTLQVLYEYQSMITSLAAMDAANASLYDGASAFAEALLLAVRGNRRSSSKRILVPRTVHPAYRACARSIVSAQGLILEELDYDRTTGQIDPAILEAYNDQDITALVIPQPNFFGVLEEADTLTRWANAHSVPVIALVNPLSLAVLEPPGRWGQEGAAICCGDGQPLGIPLSSGGPYLGFLCCRAPYLRQMPGRIVGRTLDLSGQTGYTLTLQAREQHIRRSKATSNICTNQGLMVTAATIYLALLGAEGLRQTALTCVARRAELLELLSAIPGVTPRFTGPTFHEQALQLPAPTAEVLRALAGHNILGGLDLHDHYPELDPSMLVCATETKTTADLEIFASRLGRVIALRSQAPCPVRPKI